MPPMRRLETSKTMGSWNSFFGTYLLMVATVIDLCSSKAWSTGLGDRSRRASSFEKFYMHFKRYNTDETFYFFYKRHLEKFPRI